MKKPQRERFRVIIDSHHAIGVVAGLVPATPRIKALSHNNRGGRDRPGHDSERAGRVERSETYRCSGGYRFEAEREFRAEGTSPPPAGGRPAAQRPGGGLRRFRNVLRRRSALRGRGDPTPDRLWRSTPPLAGEGKGAARFNLRIFLPSRFAQPALRVAMCYGLSGTERTPRRQDAAAPTRKERAWP